MERFIFEKLNDMEAKEKYQIKFSNRFAALENLDIDDDDINRIFESTGDNMKA
jgi:hypothetical protein